MRAMSADKSAPLGRQRHRSAWPGCGEVVITGIGAEVWLPDCENEGRLAAVPAWLAMAADYFAASSDSGLGSIAVLPLLTRASRNGRKVSAN